MSNKVICNKEDLVAIADKIRSVTGTNKTYNVSELRAAALDNISSGIDTSDATAAASHIITGRTAYVNGKKITGTMANNGTITKTIDGLNTKTTSIPAGYTSGGTIGLDNTIDNLAEEQAAKIAEIEALLEGKAAGGGSDVGTCIVNITDGIYPGSVFPITYTTVNENGNISTVSESTSSFNALVGSLFFIESTRSIGASSGVEILRYMYVTNGGMLVKITAAQGETARIDFQGMGGSN